MIHKMHMDRQRANNRIESLLKIHIDELAGNPNATRAVESLTDMKSDLHGLVDEIFDELDAIAEQEETDTRAEAEERQAMTDGA